MCYWSLKDCYKKLIVTTGRNISSLNLEIKHRLHICMKCCALYILNLNLLPVESTTPYIVVGDTLPLYSSIFAMPRLKFFYIISYLGFMRAKVRVEIKIKKTPTSFSETYEFPIPVSKKDATLFLYIDINRDLFAIIHSSILYHSWANGFLCVLVIR